VTRRLYLFLLLARASEIGHHHTTRDTWKRPHRKKHRNPDKIEGKEYRTDPRTKGS